MKITKAKDVQVEHIVAPDFDPTTTTQFTAAICDDGRLMLCYMEQWTKVLCVTFNRFETSKIRAALNKGG